jgi:hypothetical protein
MIPVAVVVLLLLCAGLIHRHHLQERQKEQSLMKRHASEYQETHKGAW